MGTKNILSRKVLMNVVLFGVAQQFCEMLDKR